MVTSMTAMTATPSAAGSRPAAPLSPPLSPRDRTLSLARGARLDRGVLASPTASATRSPRCASTTGVGPRG